jgi:hypothetical protein
MTTSKWPAKSVETAFSKKTHAVKSQVPISSIKGEVKRKYTSFGWNFSCFAAPLIERNLF